jgi:glutamyl-tRNA synthetase
LNRFESVNEWTAAALEAVTRAYVQEAGVKLGDVAQPLRAALTGQTTSPPIFEVAQLFGREETLSRIKDIAT